MLSFHVLLASLVLVHGGTPTVTTVLLAPTPNPVEVKIFERVGFIPFFFYNSFQSKKQVYVVSVTVLGGRPGCDYLTINIFNSARFTLSGNTTLDLNLVGKAEFDKMLQIFTSSDYSDILAVIQNTTFHVCNVPGDDITSNVTWTLSWH